MRKAAPQELQPGMVLAKPVLRGTMVFLNEGAVLTESAISRIESMGIDNVFIEGKSEQPIPRDEAMALVENRFRNHDDSPVMMRVKKILSEHIEKLYD
ncbi:MAG: hypothetical protein PHU03_04190 [Syntrophales bacterium]|nr:hypothetical protein [Syntrophales bacterium]